MAAEPANAEEDAVKGNREPVVRMLSRAVGARVCLRNGELIGYMRRNNPNLIAFLPPEEPARSHVARDFANFLAELGQQELRADGAGHPSGMLIVTVNDIRVDEHFLARFLLDAGFHASPAGFNLRRVLIPQVQQPTLGIPSREVQ
jgi:ATP-dependent Lhr-like helicase